MSNDDIVDACVYQMIHPFERKYMNVKALKSISVGDVVHGTITGRISAQNPAESCLPKKGIYGHPNWTELEKCNAADIVISNFSELEQRIQDWYNDMKKAAKPRVAKKVPTPRKMKPLPPGTYTGVKIAGFDFETQTSPFGSFAGYTNTNTIEGLVGEHILLMKKFKTKRDAVNEIQALRRKIEKMQQTHSADLVSYVGKMERERGKAAETMNDRLLRIMEHGAQEGKFPRNG